MQSRLELFGSNFHFECNLSPNDQLMSYAPDPSVLGDAYLIEKQSTSAGWNAAMVDEDFSSGQLGMIRAFADALRSGTPPAADGWLGLQRKSESLNLQSRTLKLKPASRSMR